jgi:hypothetical protein
VGGHHSDVAVVQPLDHIRRGSVHADNADDQAGTAFPAGHHQHITNARPHHGTYHGLAALIISSAVPLITSMARVTQKGHWPRGPDRRDVRHQVAPRSPTGLPSLATVTT